MTTWKFEPYTANLAHGTEIQIREALPVEAGAILEYVEQMAGESDNASFGPGEFDLTEEQETEYLQMCLEKDGQLCLVAMLDGEIAGALTFGTGKRPRTRHVGEFGISVRKHHWGRGIGSHLLQALIDWAEATEVIKKINLRVRTDNVRGIRLYESKGFQVEGRQHNEMYVRGVYYDHYLMGLEL